MGGRTPLLVAATRLTRRKGGQLAGWMAVELGEAAFDCAECDSFAVLGVEGD